MFRLLLGNGQPVDGREDRGDDLKLYNDVSEALDYTLGVLQDIEDRTVWVIPQSGGKDSRTTAQIVLALIADGKLDPPDRLVFYLADTLGEFPSFIDQAQRGLENLEEVATGLGVKCDHFTTVPRAHDDFWVALIGNGNIPPTSRFRWCTDKLKLRPARQVLQRAGWLQKPQLLGVRYGESERRDEIMSCTVTGECGPDYLHFRLGKSTPRVGPIKQWKACAVWDWLTIYAPSYGFENGELVDHYNMNSWLHDREHVEKLDERTGLRYGCWFCPLIHNDFTAAHLKKDNPMVAEMMVFADTNLRQGGEAWKPVNRERMTPLDGDTSDGRLSVAYCEKLLRWLNEFQARWDHALIAPWQRSMIEGLIAYRKAHGGAVQPPQQTDIRDFVA